MKNDAYEVVIGLEVHAQLLTKTKLFCADTTLFGLEPNTQVSAISLSHPGTLPKLNAEAIQLAIKLGLATNCRIIQQNYFARKNYFYPDLPKGYQISQHTTPICRDGSVEVDTTAGKKLIRLNRIHIEEDAGKSIHDGEVSHTQVDCNRAGMPLLEIVTEPDIRSAEEATAYVTQLRKLVRRLGVCAGNMEQGSLRCDVNISVRKKGDVELGTKVEIKNLNSIRFIKKAIETESANLIIKLERGETILQQTKGLREGDFSTYVIRTKEDEDDYRYFAEPDLPPFVVSAEEINEIKQAMPPTQQQVKTKLIEEYALSDYDASQLAEDDELVSLFTNTASSTPNKKAVANWMLGPVRNHLLQTEESNFPIQPQTIARLINLIDDGIINFGTASQNIFPHLLLHPETDINQHIQTEKLQMQSADDLQQYIDAALTKYADKIIEYKKGKKGLLSLFVGDVMRATKGKANADDITREILKRMSE